VDEDFVMVDGGQEQQEGLAIEGQEAVAMEQLKQSQNGETVVPAAAGPFNSQVEVHPLLSLLLLLPLLLLLLLQNRHILPGEEVTPPKLRLQLEQWNSANCSTGIFRSTLTRIPETEARPAAIY
jgi:hypothetical protein